MDIAAGIAAATGALQIVRDLKELDAAFDKAVMKGQMVELMDKVSDAKMALIDSREALREKDAEIAVLKAAAQVRSATVEKYGLKYAESDEEPGQPVGFPFCSRCDEVDGKMITTVNQPVGRGSMCPQCKQVYVDGTRFLRRRDP